MAGEGWAINAWCYFVKTAQEFSVLAACGTDAEGSFHLIIHLSFSFIQIWEINEGLLI